MVCNNMLLGLLSFRLYTSASLMFVLLDKLIRTLIGKVAHHFFA